VAGGSPVRAQAGLPFCGYSDAHGWYANSKSNYVAKQAGANDKSGIPEVVRRIEAALGFQAAITVLILKDEQNAFATVAGGQKVLAVDVDFVDVVNQRANTRWAAIQVIAHEIGHHISSFTPSGPMGELNADYWSGQALQRLGAARNATTAAILAVGTEYDTPTHPNKYTRADTIGRGWDDAARGAIDYQFCNNLCR
jgi:hypothetical protein